MKVLILSQCTKKKLYNGKGTLSFYDFKTTDKRKQKEQKLSKMAAYDMYRGGQHLKIKEGIEILRKKYGAKVIDFYIISAGYGLINENDKVAPYDVTFVNMSKKMLLEWSNKLNIHNNTEKLLKKYDLVFILLGNKYLEAVQFPCKIKENAKVVFFTNSKSYEKIRNNNSYFVNCGKSKETGSKNKKLDSGYTALKGYYFNKMVNYICNNNMQFSKIYQNPNLVNKIIKL